MKERKRRRDGVITKEDLIDERTEFQTKTLLGWEFCPPENPLVKYPSCVVGKGWSNRFEEVGCRERHQKNFHGNAKRTL